MGKRRFDLSKLVAKVSREVEGWVTSGGRVMAALKTGTLQTWQSWVSVRQRPQNSNFCFFLLNGKPLPVTWALAVAIYMTACNSLGIKMNFIILFPTLEWMLSDPWSYAVSGAVEEDLSSGALALACINQLTGTSFRYVWAPLWNDVFRARFAVLVFICSLFSLVQKITVVSKYYSAWDLTLTEGFKWTLSVFRFPITRQILPMQLPSIWRYRTPEPSKRSTVKG